MMLALFRMELRRKNILVLDGTGELKAVVAGRGSHRITVANNMKTVHEIKVAL